jgi:hypothetical protein
MINILIIITELNKNIFPLCFNIKKKILCKITIVENSGVLKKLVNDKYDKKNLDFSYYDDIIDNIPNIINEYNLVITNEIYDYNDFFKKLKLDKFNQLDFISKDTVKYLNISHDYNYKFIDSKINIDSKLHNSVNLNSLIINKTSDININFILYGFTRCNRKINIKNKMRKLSNLKRANLYYCYPDIFNEPIEDLEYIPENFFNGMYFDGVNIKKYNYNSVLKNYISKLKSNNFLRNYIDKLNIRFKIRFIRIYSMINSIKSSLLLLDLNNFNDNDYFIITRYDILKTNPNIQFMNDMYSNRNYIFSLRDKYHPSIEDRILILNKKCLKELIDFYDDFDNKFENLIKKEIILANNGILSGEYFLRNVFLKTNYFYQINNLNIKKHKVNKKKNTNNVYKYYNKLWNSI